MYKDLISYQLAENISEEHLIMIAQEIVNNWMKHQPGFIKWEINKDLEGNYTDIVSWESMEAAKLAEKEMVNIPNASAWFACYKEGTITSKNISLLADF